VGLLCVGLFAEEDRGEGWTKGQSGIFRGGTFYLLKVQFLAAVCISIWAASVTFILLYVINNPNI
jgi:ammonia channel protein AmtB